MARRAAIGSQLPRVVICSRLLLFAINTRTCDCRRPEWDWVQSDQRNRLPCNGRGQHSICKTTDTMVVTHYKTHKQLNYRDRAKSVAIGCLL